MLPVLTSSTSFSALNRGLCTPTVEVTFFVLFLAVIIFSLWVFCAVKEIVCEDCLRNELNVSRGTLNPTQLNTG